METLLSPSSAQPASFTPAAERMRRHRQRRRDGLRCLIIELRETEIAALIRKGLLKPEMHNEHDSHYRRAICPPRKYTGSTIVTRNARAL
jgi:hypothetical protein